MVATKETAPRRVNDRGQTPKGLASMPDVPYGYCHCGCGQQTALAPQSATRNGWIKGEPVPYVRGHSTRGRTFIRKPVRWVAEDRGYDTPCWIWQLACNEAGYGRVPIPGRQGGAAYAHREAYAERHGQIPEGLVIDHLCRVTSCVNPDHLEAVTQAENVRRGQRWQKDLGSKRVEETVRAEAREAQNG